MDCVVFLASILLAHGPHTAMSFNNGQTVAQVQMQADNEKITYTAMLATVDHGVARSAHFKDCTASEMTCLIQGKKARVFHKVYISLRS